MRTFSCKIIVIVCILSIGAFTTFPFPQKEAQADDWVKTVWTISWDCYKPKSIGSGWVLCGYDTTTEEDKIQHTGSGSHQHPAAEYKDTNGNSYTNGSQCPCP